MNNRYHDTTMDNPINGGSLINILESLRNWGKDKTHDEVNTTQEESLRQDARMRLIEASRELESEFHEAEQRTNDPILLTTFTWSWQTLQSCIAMALDIDSSMSTQDINRLANRIEDQTKAMSKIREPIEEREDRTAGARYITRIHDNLHETKEIMNTDQLLYALEDMFRRFPQDKPVRISTVTGGPLDDTMHTHEGMSLDWGKDDTGEWQIIIGDDTTVPLPQDTPHDTTVSPWALVQPDELGVGLNEHDIQGINVEAIVRAIDAVRHDDFATIRELQQEDPELLQIASIADGLMVSWYDDEHDRPSIKEAALRAVELSEHVITQDWEPSYE